MTTKTLTEEERADLQTVLRQAQPVEMSIDGEGADRQVSFYARGTRLEARIDVPEDAQS